MTDRRAPRPMLLVLGLLVFAAALWQNLDDVPVSRFHPDESRWINRAHYVRDLRDPLGETWSDRYLVRGQPPFGSYVTGLGLLLQGRDLTTNGPWDFHRGDEWNVSWNAAYGNMPARADLEAARRTNAAIGALTAVVLFVVLLRLSNWVAALAGGLFLAIHPLQIYLSSIAVSDAVLTFLLALATLAIMALADRPTWGKAVLVGVLLGFGASTKLTPLFLSFGLAGIGGLIVLDPWLRRLRWIGRPWGWVSRADDEGRRIGWMLLSLPAVTFATFVVSYPYLWPDPVGRTRHLIAFRRQEMESQARIWETASIDSRFEALHRVWLMLQDRYSTTGRLTDLVGPAISIDVPLAVFGLVVFTWLALRRGVPSRHFLALALLGGQALVIVLGLRVDFNRYYLPILLSFAAGVGVLAGQGWAALPRLAELALPGRARRVGRRRAPAMVGEEWNAGSVRPTPRGD